MMYLVRKHFSSLPLLHNDHFYKTPVYCASSGATDAPLVVSINGKLLAAKV